MTEYKQEEIKSIKVEAGTITITYETYIETIDNNFAGKQYVDSITHPELKFIRRDIIELEPVFMTKTEVDKHFRKNHIYH